MTNLDMIRDLISQGESDERYWGVVVAIVTNNKDPDGLNRVKVRFPWLTDDDESHWARVATPMAGNGRGFYCLPEVDDEVLVAFDRGSVEYPYVIGSLWNGKDAPPESNSDGKNNMRTLKSRSGSLIRLNDTDGSEKVEIIGANGGASIVFDLSNNSITIKAEGDLTLQGPARRHQRHEGGYQLMGQPAAKQGDQIVAIHNHVVLVPSPGGPVPTPTIFPFAGKIDGDLSADVNIEGQPAATKDSTASNSPQHVPPSGSFAVAPSNKGQIVNGSSSVNINGKPAARTGDPANGCDLPGAQVVAAGVTVFIG